MIQLPRVLFIVSPKLSKMKLQRAFSNLLLILAIILNPQISNTSADIIMFYDFEFGSTGSGDGEFGSPNGVETNGTHVFVSDAYDRVQVFDMFGHYVMQFGTSGTGDGQFNNPNGIAVNSTNIFVADQSNHRVQIFDLKGTYVDQFGSQGTANGQFDAPTGIEVDESGIYVCDSNNKRVEILDLSGNFVDSISVPCLGLAVNSTHIFVGVWDDQTLNIYTKSGTLDDKIVTYGKNDQLFAPWDVELTEDYIITTDVYSKNYGILIFDYSGEFQYKIGEEGSGAGQFGSGSFGGGTLAVDGNRIYISDATYNRVEAFLFGEYNPNQVTIDNPTTINNPTTIETTKTTNAPFVTLNMILVSLSAILVIKKKRLLT